MHGTIHVIGASEADGTRIRLSIVCSDWTGSRVLSILNETDGTVEKVCVLSSMSTTVTWVQYGFLLWWRSQHTQISLCVWKGHRIVYSRIHSGGIYPAKSMVSARFCMRRANRFIFYFIFVLDDGVKRRNAFQMKWIQCAVWREDQFHF